MPHFMETYTPGEPVYFDADIHTYLQGISDTYTARNNITPIYSLPFYFSFSQYTRRPAISSSVLKDYDPFTILGMALSTTLAPISEEHPKGSRYAFSFFKCETIDADRMSRNLTEIIRNNSLQYQSQQYDETYTVKFVKILHATQNSEFTVVKTVIEAEGMTYNQLTSAMLLPSASYNVRVYTAADSDTVYIMINKLSITLIHRIIAMLPVLFNIELDKLPVPVDAKLFTSFATGDADVFYAESLVWFAQLVKTQQTYLPLMSKQQLIKQLQVMQTSVSRAIYDKTRNQIERYNTEVRTYETNFLAALKKLRAAQLQNTTGISESLNLLIEYLPKVSALMAVYPLTDTWWGFVIQTVLTNYEPAEGVGVERSFKARGDYLNAMIVRALFIDELYKVKICQGFQLNFDSLNTDTAPYKAWSLDGTGYQLRINSLWNPHLKYFGNGEGCWGENGPYVGKALYAGDYVGAFNQALSAVRSIYLNDGMAAGKLYRDITSQEYRNCLGIIRVSDNQEITCGQFITEITAGEAGH